MNIITKLFTTVAVCAGLAAGYLSYMTSAAANPLVTYGAEPLRTDWPPQLQQAVSDPMLTAVNYYFVIDGSGSMAGSQCARSSSKMAVARMSLKQFIQQQLPASANTGMLVFDRNGLSERRSLSVNNRDALTGAIDAVRSGGSTPLARSVRLGREALETQAARQLGYGEYNLIIITDGEADHSDKLQAEVESVIQNTPINISTIGFCLGNQHILNNPGYTNYTSADSPQALKSALDSVLAESEDFVISEFNQGSRS